jgi:GAF domain-containing protein
MLHLDLPAGQALQDESDPLTSALHALAGFMLTVEEVGERARRIVDLALEAFPAADFAGLSLFENGTIVTAASTDPFTFEIDAEQYATGEGPCMQAIDTHAVVRVDSTGDDERWHGFGPRAASKGIGSLLSFPLVVDGTLGALNLYARIPGAFIHTDHRLGGLFGTQVGVALHNARIFSERARLAAEQLNEALMSRAVIDQAKGILMEREGVTAHEGFEMLRAISRDNNLRVHEVARLLVQSVERPRP